MTTMAKALMGQAGRFEGLPVADVLALTCELAPHVAFATGFGVEGCLPIDVIATRRLPIQVFTLDTGLLFPETYALWERLEARYGIRIMGVRPVSTLEGQAAAEGPALWARDPERCCALRKVEPLRAALVGLDAWVTAIRREQTAARAQAAVVEWDAAFGLVKVNPLAGWTSARVWEHVRDHDVPYNPLHDDGFPSIGCAPCTTPVRPGEDPRSGRWRGRDKTECGLHRRAGSVPSSPGGEGASSHVQTR